MHYANYRNFNRPVYTSKMHVDKWPLRWMEVDQETGVILSSAFCRAKPKSINGGLVVPAAPNTCT